MIAERYNRLGDVELTTSIHNIQKALDMWQSLEQAKPKQQFESKLLQAGKLYGGPLWSLGCVESVCTSLKKSKDFLSQQLDKRPTATDVSTGEPEGA